MRYQRLADGRCLLKDFSSIPDICRDSAFWEWRIYATGNEFGWLLNNGERYGKKVQAKIIEGLFPSENPLDAELKFVHEDLQGKTVTAVIPVLAFGDWSKPVWEKPAKYVPLHEQFRK